MNIRKRAVARSVDDLSLIPPIIAGPDYIDPGIFPMAFDDPKMVDLTNLGVAFHSDNGIISPSSETENVVREAALKKVEKSEIVYMDPENRRDMKQANTCCEKASPPDSIRVNK